jgi:signal transduction histidine kinase
MNVGLEAIERWKVGAFTVFAVACVAVSLAMSEERWSFPAVAAALTLTAAFVLNGIVRPIRSAAGYFTSQIALSAAILALFAEMGAFGIVWLLMMPLVAQSVMELSWRGVLTISLVTLVLYALPIVRLGGLAALPEPLVGYGLALFFVILFSLVAVEEQTQRQKAELLARDLEEANRSLAEAAEQAEELAVSRERNRIAREIHDTIGHSLTVVNVQLEGASILIDRDPQLARRNLQTARRVTAEALGELRRSVSTLREDFGALHEELQSLVTRTASSGRCVDLEIEGRPRRLSPELAADFYRIAQEGLTNVLRHSDAKSARVRLAYLDRSTVLTITDDGRGSVVAGGEGFGLLGIRERIQSHGGDVKIETGSGSGFTLVAEVPS